MPYPLSLLQFAILGVVALGPVQAAAQTLPERFLGVWQDMEGDDRTCSGSDWNSDRHSDTHIRILPRQFEAHEQSCRIASIQKALLWTFKDGGNWTMEPQQPSKAVHTGKAMAVPQQDLF